MNYIEQFKKLKVNNYLTHFQNDFQTDCEELQDYQGEFLYAIRKTGTDLFLIDPFTKAIDDLKKLKQSDYFTRKGIHYLVNKSTDDLLDSLYGLLAIRKRETNERFFFGSNGQIKEISHEEVEKIVNEKLVKKVDDFKLLISEYPEIKNFIENSELKTV